MCRLGTDKESDDDLLSQAQCLLSLARERFTVLFGMGRGGSTLLWSSDKGVRNESCRAHPRIRIVRGADRLAILGRLSGSRCADPNQVMRRVWKKVWG